MVIKKVETKEEALECNKLLTKLIREEKTYNSNTNQDFEVKDWFENIYDKDDRIIYIALENNLIVGYIYVKKNKLDDTYIEKEEAIFDGLYVLEEYRNKGIAGSLINKAKEWCINEKISAISLVVMYDNEIAKHLYTKLGFDYYAITLKCKL